ncbi:hypothetical protein OK348_14210 [Flavobacterium sp. MXW15]|uniref:Transmembrane protein n=1 Tax=Xanthomonas chitinilytica TaxID=2989819 RepID=A0ABT3JXY5_9XANT|nr:hypothetical protein [Xanthomonas sp. H13-6]MCW4455941.1 hypothetical protein [Flavobacterium sp. MXW15]MCW4473316.1 hypothetical protein [Xanthomonas sp. H13-6]
MSKLTVITDRALERALELAGNAGDSLRHAGSNLRHLGPQASDWIKTGAAIGAVKTGGKAATRFARRNPAVTIAAAAVGVGLIGYAIYRKRQRDRNAPLNGSAQRISPNRSTATTVDETSDIGSDA